MPPTAWRSQIDIAESLNTRKRLPRTVGLRRTWPLYFLLLAIPFPTLAQDYTGWRSYGGDAGNSHYSTLAQINTANVKHLEPAWRYASARGAELPATSELQVNPIVVDGVLYGRSPLYNVFALRADTGGEVWRFDPPLTHVGLSYMRGLTYWQGAGDSGATDRRILFTTGHYLFALDAQTGKLALGFGDQGKVDLREGLGRNPGDISLNVPSPGAIFENHDYHGVRRNGNQRSSVHCHHLQWRQAGNPFG